MADLRSPRFWVPAAVLAFLALLPAYSALVGQSFYVTLFTRILVYALAALALNFVLGFGGLVSFGHALYMGLGAYAVGILSFHGVTNGWVHLAAALIVGGVFATLVGAVVVRTGGMTFIMITLAFAQMGYFLAVSLKQYGGDDGLTIDARSQLGIVDLGSNTVLYYAVLACLVACLWLFNRMLGARFGYVLRGSKSNERRMLALGFPTFRYKLSAYVMSAMVCTLAGFFLANFTKFASPSYMQWSVSGELIVIIVLGGMGTLFGPVIGAIVLLLLEEVLQGYRPGLFPPLEEVVNKHWQVVIGLFVILVVLFAKRGLYGFIVERRE
ncbi:MAG: branched-chain amino acid ABC transporter permease [Burkholderiales bacterium]|nr:branched-chain amino acid ABC transporter permease [Burkholderiales bacterium]